MTLCPTALLQREKSLRKADLVAECVLRGISVLPGETCAQMRDRLAATTSALGGGEGMGVPLHTCAARDAQWKTEILQVFPLRRSLPTRRLGGLQGVYMAEMPATALPVAALGPEGMQTVARLAAAHSGRVVQLQAGRSPEAYSR